MRIVIIGCGTIGQTIIEHMEKEGHTLVVIDDNKNIVSEIIEKYDVMGIVGNGASLEIQEEANVQDADLVLAVTSSDEVNMLASIVAKKLGCTSTIARVRTPEYIRQAQTMQDELSISLVVNPEQETANEITDMIDLPSLLKVEKFGSGKVMLAELLIDKDSVLVGENLIDLNKKINTNFLICAVQRGEEVIIPTGKFTIQENDRINVVTEVLTLANFLQELKVIQMPLKNIMIIGGSKVAYFLAKNLLSKHYKVKIFESNKKRANDLAVMLPKATIINADGTDHELLIEEGITSTDACIMLTNIDEENIIASLYAKKIKVPKVITKIKRNSFHGMINDLGLMNVISPQYVVANKIVRYIRALANKKGSNVITLYKLVNNQVEALEFHAKKKEKIYNKPLKDLKIKNNCLIACIIRDGKVIIPKGNDCIKLDDSVLVVTSHQNFDDLMDVFE